jgi:hypothetical protein
MISATAKISGQILELPDKNVFLGSRTPLVLSGRRARQSKVTVGRNRPMGRIEMIFGCG